MIVFRYIKENRMTECYYHVTHEFHSESTLYNLPECQGTAFSKQAPYLIFKWQQQESKPQQLSLLAKTESFISDF